VTGRLHSGLLWTPWVPCPAGGELLLAGHTFLGKSKPLIPAGQQQLSGNPCHPPVLLINRLTSSTISKNTSFFWYLSPGRRQLTAPVTVSVAVLACWVEAACGRNRQDGQIRYRPRGTPELPCGHGGLPAWHHMAVLSRAGAESWLLQLALRGDDHQRADLHDVVRLMQQLLCCTSWWL
jgi:hypothetical protein